MKRRSTVTGAIDDVVLEALLQKVRHPAGTSVGCAHPIKTLPAAAMHEDDRQRMSDERRNPVLDVHLLAVDRCAASQMRLFDADPEVTPFGEVERWRRRSIRARLRLHWGCDERFQERRRGEAADAQRGGTADEIAAAAHEATPMLAGPHF